jgi:crossover junction endodeoxyribonuclease RuvC
MIHCGIDPGVSGALAALDSVTREISFWDMPTVVVRSGKTLKNELDAHAISRILRDLSAESEGELLVTIEKVNAMPGLPTREGEAPRQMGATSAFNFGRGYGTLIGICAALELPFQLVHPATWKSTLMRDMGREKDASRVKAMQLYPFAADNLQRKKDHARGDALLLAHYAMVTGTAPARQVERAEPGALFPGVSGQKPAAKTKSPYDEMEPF